MTAVCQLGQKRGRDLFPKGTTGVAPLVAGRLLLLYISESYFAGTGFEPIGACLLCLKRSGSSLVLLGC